MSNLIKVKLIGGSPWGFRIQGGIDSSDGKLIVSKINPGSKASLQGVREGDVIEAINDHYIDGLTTNQSYDLIRSDDQNLTLTLRRDEPLESPRMFKSSKCIELNGTTANNSTRENGTVVRSGSDGGKNSSVPSSPISITVSSSKKAVFNQSNMDQPIVTNGASSSSKGRGVSLPDKTPPTTPTTPPAKNSTPGTPTTPLATPGTPGTTPTSGTPRTPNTKQETEGSTVIAPTFKATSATPGVWSPGLQPASVTQVTVSDRQDRGDHHMPAKSDSEPIAPVWQPFGGGSNSGKQFRSIKMESMTTTTKETKTIQESTTSMSQRSTLTPSTPPAAPPPLERVGERKSAGSRPPLEFTAEMRATTHERTPPLTPLKPTSKPAVPVRDGSSQGPASQLSPTFTRLNGTSHLPRSQSPTITLLQKAREGQIPKGASYIDQRPKDDRVSSMPRVNDNLFRVKSAEVRDDYRKIHLEPITHDGIGPTTPQGVPISLRTGIREENKGEWYKKMYKSLHRLGDSSEGRIPYSSSGYMSEPEPDRDVNEFDRHSSTLPPPSKSKQTYSTWTPPSAKYSSDVYRNQPRKIEDYEPGYSSIAEHEAKLDDDTTLDKSAPTTSSDPQVAPTMQGPTRPSGSHSYKDGYESDSTLVYHKHGSELISPAEQRTWYREIQRGGDIPITGLRRPAPDKMKDSPLPARLTRSLSSEHAPAVIDLSVLPPVPAPPPKVPLVDVSPDTAHRYQETEVNIHYKTPVRNLEKEYIEEEELQRRQEEMMKQFYEEERRKKYIQEMNDMESRRHADNFMPGQKSPIPLDRYDNPYEPPASPVPRGRTPEPKTVARARFNFSAQNARELSFQKGDVIFVNRRIDKNWYEGEHHGMIGLFPVTYVEIIPYDRVRTPTKKISEGIAKAKYNFQAQTNIELPLVKGEMVVVMRRVDRNWYMCRIGGREGIVPVAYLDVVREPMEIPVSPISPKPVASPVSRALVMNGSALSPQPNSYSQQSYFRKRNPSAPSSYKTTSSTFSASTSNRYLPDRPPEPASSSFSEKKQPVNQSLHIDTHSEPVPYRALYDYRPQNEDELELREGDTVFVMEKCDDGWYVGSSLRTGFFGTFPGNYVERL